MFNALTVSDTDAWLKMKTPSSKVPTEDGGWKLTAFFQGPLWISIGLILKKTSQDIRFSKIIVTLHFHADTITLALPGWILILFKRASLQVSPHALLTCPESAGIARHAPGRPTAALPKTKLPGGASRQFPQRVFACTGRRT